MPAAYCMGGGVCGRKWGEDTLIKSFNDLFLISIFQALESAVHMLFPPGCSWQRSWWIWSFRLLPFCEEPENTAIFSMLPRPAAVCYWMVIPWLQACVPPLTGWECACPGVSTQAKLTAANFKFSNFTRGWLHWCQQAQCAAFQHRSVSEHQAPSQHVQWPLQVLWWCFLVQHSAWRMSQLVFCAQPWNCPVPYAELSICWSHS